MIGGRGYDGCMSKTTHFCKMRDMGPAIINITVRKNASDQDTKRKLDRWRARCLKNAADSATLTEPAIITVLGQVDATYTS